MSKVNGRAAGDPERDTAAIGWQRSTHSDSEKCIEVSLNSYGDVLLRGSEEPGRVLVIEQDSWRDLMRALKDDVFVRA